MHRRFVLPTALVGATLILSGCSSSVSETELSYEDSPLNVYWSASPDSDLSEEERQRKENEQFNAEEKLIAECMTKEGFTWIPDVRGDDFVGSIEMGGSWEPESKEWVAQWGYGTVDGPWREAQENYVEPELTPTQKYIASLSESELSAFNKALYGDDYGENNIIAGTDDYEYHWEDNGCAGAAQHEVQGDPYEIPAEFDDLLARMGEVYVDENNPDQQALDKEWSSCMADAGQSGFAKQPDAASSISDEYNKISEAAYEEHPEGNFDDLSLPGMKELGEVEIALAVIDLECREKTSYRQRELQIQFDLEEQFVQQNKAELDRYKAAAEQGR